MDPDGARRNAPNAIMTKGDVYTRFAMQHSALEKW